MRGKAKTTPMITCFGVEYDLVVDIGGLVAAKFTYAASISMFIRP
jgi:hypothetical protein